MRAQDGDRPFETDGPFSPFCLVEASLPGLYGDRLEEVFGAVDGAWDRRASSRNSGATQYMAGVCSLPRRQDA